MMARTTRRAGVGQSKKLRASALAFALLLAACGDDAEGDTTTTAAETPDTTAGETTDTTTAETPDTTAGEEPSGEDIVVGHMTYYTGPFADVGPWFDGATDFALDLVNESPPLGRPMVAIHQDIGTVGEASVAQQLVEADGAQVLLNIAHNYQSYRDFMLQFVADNNAPLMPSVHGGAINRELGATAEEPIFRGAPMDSAQAVAAVLKAQAEGAASLALVATEIEGSQLQMTAALQAAADLELEVVEELHVLPEQPSYRAEMQRVADSEPDAVLMFSQAEDGGTMVRQLAEAGLSTLVIGTSEWLGNAFAAAATLDAMAQHENVWISGFSYVEGPAWDFYAPLWEGSEFADLSQASNSYTIQYYDIINVTALAIEAAGSTGAAEWVAAVPEVAMGPGTQCYSYVECVELLRGGEDIDYTGVTGDMEFTDTGVVSGAFGIFAWSDLETLDLVENLDGNEILELDRG